MLKTILISIVVTIMFFSFSVGILAQTPEPTVEAGFELPDELPETPQDAGNELLVAITGILAMITVTVTNFIKDKFPDTVKGPMVDLVAAISAAALTFLGSLILVAVDFVEVTQVWPFLVWIWPTAKSIAEGQKLVRGVGTLKTS